jgi:hypothetical protein
MAGPLSTAIWPPSHPAFPTALLGIFVKFHVRLWYPFDALSFFLAYSSPKSALLTVVHLGLHSLPGTLYSD